MGEDKDQLKGKKKPRKKTCIVVNLHQCCYPIVAKAVKRRAGWRAAEAGEAWDVAWSDTNHSVREVRRMAERPSLLCPAQRINHFPNNKQLVRKDYMAENLNLLRAAAPKLFDFSPLSWSLPRDNEALMNFVDEDIRAHGALSERENVPTYIIKPANGLQGAGIKIAQSPDALEAAMRKSESGSVGDGGGGEATASVAPPCKKMVVQLYIERPLTIDGFKFDVRLYVLITSVKPLKIYLFDNGLCRLCTTKYEKPTKANMKKTRVHLTNFAINKSSKNFVPGENGTKRSLKSVLDIVKSQGHDADKVWSDVVAVVVKSLIGIAPLLAASYQELMPKSHVLRTSQSSCFEILGYDVMMDDALKVWLLEMNHMPSFSGSSPLDSAIKTGVVAGALERLGVTTRRKHLLSHRIRKKRRGDMMQQAANRHWQRLGSSGGAASVSGGPQSSSLRSTRWPSPGTLFRSAQTPTSTSRSVSAATSLVPQPSSSGRTRLSAPGSSSGRRVTEDSAWHSRLDRGRSVVARSLTGNGTSTSPERPLLPLINKGGVSPVPKSKRNPQQEFQSAPEAHHPPTRDATSSKFKETRKEVLLCRAGNAMTRTQSFNGRPPTGSNLHQRSSLRSLSSQVPRRERSQRASSLDKTQNPVMLHPKDHPLPDSARWLLDDTNGSSSDASENDMDSLAGGTEDEEEEEEEEEDGDEHEEEDKEEDEVHQLEERLTPELLEKFMEQMRLHNMEHLESSLLDAEIITPQIPAPSLDEPDKYLLVFNQANLTDCARYAPVLRAARVAMQPKLGGDVARSVDADGDTTRDEEE